jgi:acyl-CoA reductase-like NAD-dependent aldehyde dehydrogenase
MMEAQPYPLSSTVEEWLALPKRLFIGGRWVDGISGRKFPSYNPATGEVLAEVAEAESADIDRAVEAARTAFDNGPWYTTMTPSERGRMIWRLADLIEEHLDELAELETLDNGKPIRMSRGDDLPATVDHFRYFAGWATKVTGETIPLSTAGNQYFNFTLRDPVGVVGAIIPWNYPLMMAAWKLGAALACGNTVILKPAEQTPVSILRLGELFQEAGFPPGVLNIVPGYGETAGAALAAHTDVDKVAFTGEYLTGRKIIHASEGNLKRVSLELGGKSPNIIFADADIDAAIEGAAGGIFYNQGQDCSAGSRVFVQRAVYDRVVAGLVDAGKKLRVGPGLDPSSDMGPLVSDDQLRRVMSYIDGGRSDGVRVASGGNRLTDEVRAKGHFVEPTVLADVTNANRVAREEIFGPVVVCIPFDDENDAVFQANDTFYGLAAGVWSQNIGRALGVARRVRAGTVWVNCYNLVDAASPFGGYKMSGHGREMGKYALELYTEVKSVWVSTNR